MDTKLLKSVLSLAAVAVIGVGVTFAQFQADPVTITSSQLVAGDADMKLCNNAGTNNWKTSIAPALVAGDLVPGGDATELTEGSFIGLGNDDGDLENNGFDTGVCKTYGDAAGSSDVELDVVPTTKTVSCTATGLEDVLEIQLQFFNADGTPAGESDFDTLENWKTNPDVIGDTFEIGRVRQVKIMAQLDESATPEMQGENCTFDVDFTGNQPVTPPA